MKSDLTFNQLAAQSLLRAIRWHKGGLQTWDPPRWSNAAAGEMGDSGVPADREMAIMKVAKELGDTIVYLDLLAQRLGLTTEDCVRYAFNEISEREGFPERI